MCTCTRERVKARLVRACRSRLATAVRTAAKLSAIDAQGSQPSKNTPAERCRRPQTHLVVVPKKPARTTHVLTLPKCTESTLELAGGLASERGSGFVRGSKGQRL